MEWISAQHTPGWKKIRTGTRMKGKPEDKRTQSQKKRL
jgi:hypothetical protein